MGGRRTGLALILAVALVAACGTATSGSPSVAPPTSTPVSTATASPPVATASQPLPSSSALVSPQPTPSGGSANGWTTPVLIDPGSQCSTPVAAIDGSSRDHVADWCGDSVHYMASGPAGWSTPAVFDHPAGLVDEDPQIAVDGTKVYVAYSQVMPLEGCGGGADQGVGVYVRTRALPDGAWSVATRLGQAGDLLQSFRVVNGTSYAVVLGGGHNEGTVLEVSGPGGLHRYAVAGQNASLRVGDDGRPRIAYESYGDGRIGFATFTGTGLSASLIPDPPGGIGDSSNFDPHLILDGSDHAHVIWTVAPTGGCALPEGSLQDGTWYATNASGSWQISRLTIETGETSITADAKHGFLYALVDGADGMGFFTNQLNGNWGRTTILPDAQDSPSIHFDPVSGSLLVVFSGSPTASDPAGIYAMTLAAQQQ